MKVKCIVCGRAFKQSTPTPNLFIEGRGNGRSTIALSNFLKAHCCCERCEIEMRNAILECYDEWKLPRQSTEEENANESDI